MPGRSSSQLCGSLPSGPFQDGLLLWSYPNSHACACILMWLTYTFTKDALLPSVGVEVIMIVIGPKKFFLLLSTSRICSSFLSCPLALALLFSEVTGLMDRERQVEVYRPRAEGMETARAQPLFPDPSRHQALVCPSLLFPPPHGCYLQRLAFPSCCERRGRSSSSKQRSTTACVLSSTT